jgi:hypothetical protein
MLLPAGYVFFNSSGFFLQGDDMIYPAMYKRRVEQNISLSASLHRVAVSDGGL